MQRFIFLLSLIIYSLSTFAQPIQGKWTGNYGKSLFSVRPKLLVVTLELYDDNTVKGTSHLIHRKDRFEHYTVSGLYSPDDSSIVFTEDSTLGKKLALGVDNCLGEYSMKLITTDSSYRLEGMWRDKSRSFFGCGKSTVWLEKKFDKETKVQHQINSDKNLKRVTDIQSLIELDKEELEDIKIEVYDNQQIDGDRVTVYFNDVKQIDNQMINAHPISFKVSIIDLNRVSQQIKLSAESMGRVEPCTAHLIVTTSKKRYELDLSSNMSKNGTIEFFMK